MSKIDSTHTVYASGKTMLTPLDPFMKHEAQKFHQFEHDHLLMQQGVGTALDPFLEGPYAITQSTTPGFPELLGPSKPVSPDSVVRKPRPQSTTRPVGPRAAQPTPAPKPDAKDAQNAGVSRPLYTGGAPALRADQMDQAVVNSSPILKFFYALPERFAWLRSGYMGFTRVAGPIGAVVNVGFNLFNLKRIWQDPHAPAVLKGGVVASTALAGASAYAAVRLGLSSFGIGQMTTTALKSWGKFAGAAGMGAGAILSAMDTFNTFRDPKSTNAEKVFSSLTTVASVLATASVIFPVLAPIALAAGVGTIVFSVLKGVLGHNQAVNNFLGSVGHGLAKLKFW